MLEIKITLKSARDGHSEVLAVATIGNIGPNGGGYEYIAVFSPTKYAGKEYPSRTSIVHDYPREDHSPWELLARALLEAGYGLP